MYSSTLIKFSATMTMHARAKQLFIAATSNIDNT